MGGLRQEHMAPQLFTVSYCSSVRLVRGTVSWSPLRLPTCWCCGAAATCQVTAHLYRWTAGCTAEGELLPYEEHPLELEPKDLLLRCSGARAGRCNANTHPCHPMQPNAPAASAYHARHIIHSCCFHLQVS